MCDVCPLLLLKHLINSVLSRSQLISQLSLFVRKIHCFTHWIALRASKSTHQQFSPDCGTVNMSLKNICFHNKFGFCKFGGRCFRLHENKLCENDNCNIQECPLRHPKFCRYFGKFKYCKFGTYCRFRHYGIRAQEREPRRYDEEIDN